MDIRTRRLGGSAGEMLTSILSPQAAGIRYSEFLRETGLAGRDVVICNLVTQPLPLYPPAWPDGRNRWAGIKPEVMWHPIFWLPARLAERRRLDIGGSVVTENDELWSTRVAIELTAAGLYDDAEGAWIDVLALHGLDIDDVTVVARVQAWLNGSADPILDDIDLSEHLDVGEEDWALSEAWTTVKTLRPVAWVLHSNALGIELEDVSEALDEYTDEELSNELGAIAAFATLDFAALPAEFDAAWWRKMAWETPSTRGALELVLDQMRERLSTIETRYWETARDTIAAGAAWTEEFETDPQLQWVPTHD